MFCETHHQSGKTIYAVLSLIVTWGLLLIVSFNMPFAPVINFVVMPLLFIITFALAIGVNNVECD